MIKMRLVIQNGRRQPFCENKIKLAYCSEMVRSAIEIHFRSSKMGGHHNGQPVSHSGKYTNSSFDIIISNFKHFENVANIIVLLLCMEIFYSTVLDPYR